MNRAAVFTNSLDESNRSPTMISIYQLHMLIIWIHVYVYTYKGEKKKYYWLFDIQIVYTHADYCAYALITRLS